ncbi:MAG TPA: 1-acyl-sn-glycerol-3-phosphate acyltransferase, partial [Kofleriaceae bacterium]|nr:1-acyl-sn-glycerol-3-phosphate acyltransferase [Kofleriaceae bacterium]
GRTCAGTSGLRWHVAYRVLAWFLRLVTRVFFRQVEVVGLENIPPGAVLFAGNHPNSLIDPMLIITTCGRRVHFAAKDALFKGRIMRVLLRGLGAVPVARKVEHDGHGASPPATAAPRDSADMGRVNDAAFTHMFDVLANGGAIGIFPEGLSHDESHLAKLKTGAARLALGGAAAAGRSIAVVPCGLTFIHPKRFRSRVLVQYGPPLEIGARSEPEAVQEVTDDIDAALRRLTINAPDWETVRALDTVRRLYQPQEISIEDRIELARRFNTYYAAVAAAPEVVSLMARVRAYQDKLDELGVSDRELAMDLSKREVTVRMMRHLVLVAWWLPLCLPGAPLHLPTVAFARMAGPRLTPRKDVIATTKMLVGMLLVLGSYAAAVAVLGWQLGVWFAIGAAIVLPLSGWATLRVLDRLRLVRRAFGVLARRLRFRSEVHALRAERATLAADVIRIVTAVKPHDLEALFPADKRDDPPETSRARRDADLDDELDKDATEARAEDDA